MTYLLDVNVLLAFRYDEHVHHWRVSRWLDHLKHKEGARLQLATCAITELGFVRVASGPARLRPQVARVCADLARLKRDPRFTFFGDEISAQTLPAWVSKSKQTTDGHLLQLASSHGAAFATLDTRIPGALLVPERPENDNQVSEPTTAYGVAA